MNAKLSHAQNGISTSKIGVSSWLVWETGGCGLSLAVKINTITDYGKNEFKTFNGSKRHFDIKNRGFVLVG